LNTKERPAMTEAEEKKAPDITALEQEGEIAADYVEGLLDIADIDGDIDMDVEGDRAMVSIVGSRAPSWSGPRERCWRRCRS
jgi:spoIIIJ-associated protein